MTIREKITQTIYEYLQSISVSNGYTTNAGSAVSLWGTQIIPHNDVVDLNLKDKKREHKRGFADVLYYEIEISYNGMNAYKNICNLLYDVEKALYDNQDDLSLKLNDSARIYFESSEIELTREKDKERAYAVALINIEFNYSEKWKLGNNNY